MAALGEAVVFEAINVASKYTNTMPAVVQQISNGKIVELTVGVLGLLLGKYETDKMRSGQGSQMLAALGITTGSFLIVDAVVNMVVAKLNIPQLGEVAVVRNGRVSAIPVGPVNRAPDVPQTTVIGGPLYPGAQF